MWWNKFGKWFTTIQHITNMCSLCTLLLRTRFQCHQHSSSHVVTFRHTVCGGVEQWNKSMTCDCHRISHDSLCFWKMRKFRAECCGSAFIIFLNDRVHVEGGLLLYNVLISCTPTHKKLPAFDPSFE